MLDLSQYVGLWSIEHKVWSRGHFCTTFKIHRSM